MFLRSLITGLAAMAIAAPAGAAADTTITSDPAAKQLTALDGTLVWVSGEYGAQVLMRNTAEGIGRVPGAAVAKSYTSIDLGRDATGALVLTYLRCSGPGRCVARRDDLHGHRAGFRGLELRRCSLTTAPAIWRTRVAYGLECRTGTRPTLDRKRSGLYVKTRSGAPRRLPLPKEAVKYGIALVNAIDLRGTRVAAVAADVYEYAFSQTVGGSRQTSFLAAASEGDGDARSRGVALGPGGVLWTLVNAQHAGDPNQAIIHRLVASCHEWEALPNPPGPDEESGYRATDVAVDGATTYLVVPGSGIVSHEFAPARPCAGGS